MATNIGKKAKIIADVGRISFPNGKIGKITGIETYNGVSKYEVTLTYYGSRIYCLPTEIEIIN